MISQESKPWSIALKNLQTVNCLSPRCAIIYNIELHEFMVGTSEILTFASLSSSSLKFLISNSASERACFRRICLPVRCTTVASVYEQTEAIHQKIFMCKSAAYRLMKHARIAHNMECTCTQINTAKHTIASLCHQVCSFLFRNQQLLYSRSASGHGSNKVDNGRK